MDDASRHELTHLVQQSGVSPGDAEKVAEIVSRQLESEERLPIETTALFGAMAAESNASRFPGRLKWSNITLKRGTTADTGWPCKWKGFSLDGKSSAPAAEIRELVHEIISQR